MVRNRIGSREDRSRFAVLAVRIGEEKRFGGRETLVHDAAFAHEAAFQCRAVIDAGRFADDEVVGLDIHADMGVVAQRAVLERRGAVDLYAVADAYLADEAGPGDAAVATDFAHFGAAFFGVCLDHPFESGDGLRAVAVDGHDIGDLRRHRVVDLHRAAAAFVHRRDARAVAERAATAAFERRDAFDERSFADPVVAYAGADDAGVRGDLDASFEVALLQLGGGEILRYENLRPVFGRDTEGTDGFDLGRTQGGEWKHGCLQVSDYDVANITICR